MNGNELLTAVTAMGFACSPDELQHYFFTIANQSLRQIAVVFPLLKEKEITLTPKDTYYTSLTLTDYVDDFLSLAPSPLSSQGQFFIGGRDYYKEGKTLFIPKERTGKLTVRYHALPEQLTPSNMALPLSINPVAEHLLPLLCASYLWAQDEPEISLRYLKLYSKEAGILRGQQHLHAGASYQSINGWDR